MRKLSIMIIDDDEVDRYLLKRVIKKFDRTIKVFESGNGQEALDFLLQYEENSARHPEHFPPTLIFLDVNMPIMGGFDFLEAFSKVRRDVNNYDSSVFIMFSSSESDEDKQRVSAYDFVKGYIVKGKMSSDVLRGTIEKCGADKL